MVQCRNIMDDCLYYSGRLLKKDGKLSSDVFYFMGSEGAYTFFIYNSIYQHAQIIQKSSIPLKLSFNEKFNNTSALKTVKSAHLQSVNYN